ncbi:pyrroloquinoline quinone biosynthesis peptide chaperone PqqD [Lichenihabitans psoromatis]|uniref:pyrroloquinoline quinone biosynthesis peptide chaperone PqqD n=1 Tax=Lichenihabitans psoromatis TaxID=2528642 RepID=UPI0010358214|nr:pyrroloquinoline quinone biosynthesis peptide chaperone PqqD [Lichenihabitans psoromatis]
MTDSTALPDDAKPHLPRGVRLRHDETRGEWTLLAPERILKLDAVAVEVLKRCTGIATITAIVDDLATTFAADRTRIDTDVRAMLAGLHDKRMLDL